MQALEHSIKQTDEVLMAMPPERLSRLGDAMQRLTPQQIAFIRCTLEWALQEGHLSRAERTTLEFFFETWWKHALATKVAVIEQVIELSHGGNWPGDIESEIFNARLRPTENQETHPAESLAADRIVGSISNPRPRPAHAWKYVETP